MAVAHQCLLHLQQESRSSMEEQEFQSQMEEQDLLPTGAPNLPTSPPWWGSPA